MIAAEILPASCDYEAMRTSWDRLFQRSDREPSLSFAWSRAILRNHLAKDRDWFMVVLRQQGQMEAIVPMFTLRERFIGREVVTIQPIQEKYNTHSDLLVGAGAEYVGAWLDQLFGMKRRWDLIYMSRLLEGSSIALALEHELRRRGLRHRWRPAQPSFYLRLPMKYVDYLAARSGKFRNYLKRAERRLAGLGRLEFDCGTGAAGVDADYEELLAIERDSWKHAHGTAISAVSHQSGFYHDLCATARESGMLHLSFLRLDGVALAYNLGLIVGDCYYYIKTSYRDAYREHGAATVGRAHLIRHLIERGLGQFDFPGAPYEWEQQWTDDFRWHRSLQIFNRTLRGNLMCAASSLRESLRGSKVRRIVFKDPRSERAGE